jgi:hypothetical protein
MTLVGVLLTGLSVHGAATEIDLRSLSLESAGWTEASGTIYTSEVRVHPGKRTSYEPVITYRYDVEGERYWGNRVVFATEVSESRAFELVARYRPGTSTIVWTRPADPSVSVLLRQSWDASFTLAAWLFFVLAFGGMTLVSARGSVSATSAALRRREAPSRTAPAPVPAKGAAPTRILGTFVEASDRRVVFVRRDGGPGWRVVLAAIGAVAGPAIAPLAPMAWWVMVLLVVFPAVSLELAYGALPEIALALSSLAPLRHRLRVERDDPDPYRGEPVCSAWIDGRALAPDTRRAILDVRIEGLVARVLVIGAAASLVAYAFGRAASAALPRADKRPGSTVDLAAALARVLHVEERSATSNATLPSPRWWPLAIWLVARAAAYVAVASYAPLDPLLGLSFAIGSGLALLAIEAAVVRLALARYFMPAIEALGRELRATI